MKNRNLLLGFVFVALSFLSLGRVYGQGSENTWISLGPDNVSGRSRALIFDRYNSQVMYAGGVAGGLYVSVNDGKNWQPITSGDELSNVTAIAQDANGVIYVGTGEAFYGTNNTGKLNSQNGLLGKGVYKLTPNEKVIPSSITTDSAKFVWIKNNLTYDLCTGTQPEPNNISDAKAYVNKIAVNTTNNTVYVGLQGGGLNILTDNGYTAVANIPSTSAVFDIAVSSNGKTAVFYKESFFSGNSLASSSATVAVIDSSSNVYTIFTLDTLAKSHLYQDSTFLGNWLGRLAWGKTNPEQLFFYSMFMFGNQESGTVLLRTNSTSNVYWIETTPASFSNNSSKNMALAINDNSTTPYVYLGGYNAYRGYNANDADIYVWSAITDNTASRASYEFVSSGINEILLKPNPTTTYDSNFIAVATDAGIYTYNYNATLDSYVWSLALKDMNTTQFYSVAVAADGSVVGGTVNNGSVYIAKHGDFGNNKYGDILWTLNSSGYTPNGYQYTTSGGNVAISQFQRTLPSIRKSLILSRPYCEIARTYSNDGDFTTIDDVTWTYGNVENSGKLFPSGLNENSAKINYEPEVTPMLLWESTNSTLPDSISFSITANTAFHRNGQTITYSDDSTTANYWRAGSLVLAGDSTLVKSANFNYPFFYVFPTKDTLSIGKTIKTINPIQSRLIFSNWQGLYMCVNINNYNATSEDASSPKTSMVKFFDLKTIANVPQEYVHCIAITKDGKTLFVTTDNSAADSSKLYRFDLSTTDFANSVDFALANQSVVFPRQITSINVDPNNGNNLLLTFGGYAGVQSNMLVSANALNTDFTQTTFHSLTNKDNETNATILTAAEPVYCGVIESMNHTDGSVVYIGTQSGVYRTDAMTYGSNATISWTKMGGLTNVPVTQLTQQVKRLPAIEMFSHSGQLSEQNTFERTQYPGAIYAATYGKGLFVCLDDTISENNITISLRDNVYSEASNVLRLYPNPANQNTTLEYGLTEPSNVMLQVYDMNGRMVSSMDNGRQSAGIHSVKMNVQNLKRGVYMIRVISASNVQTAKMIVR